jgi:hypothetical protein
MRVRRSNICSAVLVGVFIGAPLLTANCHAEETNTVEVIKQLFFNGGGGGAGITTPATVTRMVENVLFTRMQLAF